MSKIFGQKPMNSMNRLFRFVFVYLLLVAILPLSPTDEHQIVISEGGEEGTLKWSFKTGDLVYSSPAIGLDGTIYVGSDDFKLYAINPDGIEKWSFKTDGGVSSSPAIGSDGTIYVGSYDSKLYAIYGLGSLANTRWPMFHHDLRHSGRAAGP